MRKKQSFTIKEQQKSIWRAVESSYETVKDRAQRTLMLRSCGHLVVYAANCNNSVTTSAAFRENKLKKLIWIRLRKKNINSDVSSFVPRVIHCSPEPLFGCSLLGLWIIHILIIHFEKHAYLRGATTEKLRNSIMSNKRMLSLSLAQRYYIKLSNTWKVPSYQFRFWPQPLTLGSYSKRIARNVFNFTNFRRSSSDNKTNQIRKKSFKFFWTDGFFIVF